MAQWITVAEGIKFDELEQLVADMNLPKGTEILVAMKTPMPWLFDVAGAELAFKPFVPEGVDLIDVYGEGEYAYARMEADPIHVVPLLLAIAKWTAIAIAAGVLLATIISFIYIMVKVPAGAAIPVAVIFGIAAGIIILTAILAARGKPT